MTAEYINAHEPIYSYLVSYFLPDLSDPYFRQDAALEIELDERMTYCRYMAAWLPYEPHYTEILNRIAGATQCTNDKEDAIKHPLFCYYYILCFSIHCIQSSTLTSPCAKFKPSWIGSY